MKPRPPALGFNCHRMTVTASLRLPGPARPGLSVQSAGASAAPSPSSGFPLFLLIVRNDSLLQTRSSSCVSDTEKYRLGAPDSDSEKLGLKPARPSGHAHRSGLRLVVVLTARGYHYLSLSWLGLAGSPGPSPSQAGTGILGLGGARSHRDLGYRA